MGRKKSYNFSHTYFVSSECKCSKWQAQNLEDSSLTVPLQIWYNYHHLTWNSCIWVITRSRNPWARGNFGRCPYFSWFFFFWYRNLRKLMIWNWKWKTIERTKVLCKIFIIQFKQVHISEHHHIPFMFLVLYYIHLHIKFWEVFAKHMFINVVLSS